MIIGTFVNELNNTIVISGAVTKAGVTIIAEGPTSLIEHVWTPVEAAVLRDLLNKLDLPQETTSILNPSF
jgi:hypothetical protein